MTGVIGYGVIVLLIVAVSIVFILQIAFAVCAVFFSKWLLIGFGICSILLIVLFYVCFNYS